MLAVALRNAPAGARKTSLISRDGSATSQKGIIQLCMALLRGPCANQNLPAFFSPFSAPGASLLAAAQVRQRTKCTTQR